MNWDTTEGWATVILIMCCAKKKKKLFSQIDNNLNVQHSFVIWQSEQNVKLMLKKKKKKETSSANNK